MVLYVNFFDVFGVRAFCVRSKLEEDFRIIVLQINIKHEQQQFPAIDARALSPFTQNARLLLS